MLRLPLAVSIVVAGCVGATDGEGRGDGNEVAAVCAPLYYGSEDAGISLSASQHAAIGAIVSSADEVACTGTLIRPGWVLTARHCNGNTELFFATGEGSEPEVRVPVLTRVEHSESELMLLEIEATPELLALAPQPLRLRSAPLEQGWDSEVATAAGFGLREDGDDGRREFIDELVVEVTADHVTIDGMGDSGACTGDSGGPLLVLNDGEPVIAGVLDRGSRSCLGVDLYTRVDPWLAWIERICGPLAEPISRRCSVAAAE